MRLNRKFLFYVARGASVGVKPVTLYILLDFGLTELANLLSIYFLAYASLMIILNNEAHFDFYKNIFSDQKIIWVSKARSEIVYYQRLIYQFIVFIMILFGLIYLYVDDIFYSLAFLGAISLEKVIDEIQRILLFKKDFEKWSLVMLSKSVGPFLILFVPIFSLLSPQTTLFWIFLSSSLMINLVVILLSLTHNQLRRIYRLFLNLNIVSLKRYFNDYRRKLIFNQIQAVSTRNIPLTDRMLIRFFKPELLAQYSFLAQIGTIPVLFIDMFLISTKRKEYLESKKKINEVVSPTKLVLYGLMSLAIFGSIILLLNYVDRLLQIDLSLSLIGLIGVYFCIFAVSQHFANYSFWRVKRKVTLLVDLCYYVMTIIIFLLLEVKFSAVEAIIITLLCTHVIRLVILIVLSRSYYCNQ